MTKEEAIKTMKSIADGSFYADLKYADGTKRLWDQENQHCDADDLLCKFLRELGHGDLVDAFESVPKWYA